MFNLTKQTIALHNTVHQIEKYEVWFRTPFGLFEDINKAIKECIGRDLDPELMIVPVPVAVAPGIYEVLMR